MSTVSDRNVLDLTYVEDGKFILVIVDDLKWETGTREQHGHILQDKINDYINFIVSGQAEEMKPGHRCVIRIVAQYSYSQYCIDFLNRVKDFLKSKGDFCDLEWTHAEGETGFDDGFSDDFVFDIEKVYPRLRKNWSKDPLNEVSLTAVNEQDYPSMPMMRIMDSYIICYIQDMGNVFTYIDYDKLPEGLSVEEMNNKAFENLSRDIRYRYEESKIAGIFGVLCGGDFEAEVLLFDGAWKNIADEFGDDLMIVVPTKDMVMFTKASDKKLCKELLNRGRELFDSNQKETPYLLFSRDVFIFSREESRLILQKKSL